MTDFKTLSDSFEKFYNAEDELMGKSISFITDKVKEWKDKVPVKKICEYYGYEDVTFVYYVFSGAEPFSDANTQINEVGIGNDGVLYVDCDYGFMLPNEVLSAVEVYTIAEFLSKFSKEDVERITKELSEDEE